MFVQSQNPPMRTASNYLTQLFTSFPLPKWVISNKLRISVFTKPATHCFGCNIGSPNDHVPRLSIYTYCANFGNLLVSDTSWSAYHNLSTHPNKLGVSFTPSAMRDKTIEASGCLHRDHAMGCFPFLCAGVLDVPASGSLSSQPDSSFLVISLSCTSSCCANPTIGCGLGPSYFLLSLSMPFVLWDASALEVCCGLVVANGSWPHALSCESMSILTIIGACPSSSTSVELTGSICGNGITSILTIPSVYVNACSASMVSCGDLWLLRVFRVVWLGALTFKGAIVGSSSFSG
jgi:hypothetical protein